ncbi:hypothetical protein M378DRAFT_123710 [Amanita muscaria Koide BX008]|uniref:Uncharacterized protein n=1 Tax=Amanita muscaria (strain Koide BX008) TaxID=946122 RepID=A0A0C2XB61_AMAMK|nr:hypothetical protein M378DRAFT_123710 [Amanita muscaria Koide BX008]
MPRNAKRTRKESDSVAEFDSDALDGDDAVPVTPRKTPRKIPRKAAAPPTKAWDSDALDESSEENQDNTLSAVKGKRKNNQKQPSLRKSKRRRSEEASEEEEGQEVVGVIIQAPKTGLVPPGRISKNTLDFLTKLKDKECNDRGWCVSPCSSPLHEPVYRQAEKEFRDFIERFTDLLIEADPQIPHLPPKDVVHRIYRDVRFSNDKTPYKGSFSASFSRSGRKGIFAGLKPGNESLVAAGSWCPGRNELATIRSNIQRSSRRLRQTISSPTFVTYFGEAKPHPKGQRQNIFGMEDELKVAPKGIDKEHRDIDLLKCRSFAVVHRFTDSEVLDPEFGQMVKSVVQVMRPFVYCLNDLMTVGYNEESEDGEEDQGEEEEE